MRDPEMSIVRVAVHAYARINNRRRRERRKGRPQKVTQIFFVLGIHNSLGRLGRHFSSGTVISDLYDSIAVDGETVIAGRRNIRAENRKTFGREQLRL